jgi:type IV secretory pathway VirB10-like protein
MIMNTFWLKVAAAAVAVVVVIVLIGMFKGSGEPKPQEPQKGFYDVVKSDRERLNAEPQPAEPNQTTPAAQQDTAAQQQTAQNQAVQPTAPSEPPMPQFKPLEFEEEVEAQKLWEWVVTQRSMGRLPVMTYGEMVRKCRDIKQRWPGTKYAYLATRALADLPEKYQQMYNIKPAEIDLKNF